ncbi:hypothetical protein BFJ70_g11741 [Fusarium oxysporum]|nr:hypothetical protein BFJ70_g11741 [Fusarium oxysporum]
MGEAIPPEDGTYSIKGLPRPPEAMRFPEEIPYVKGLSVRKEISSLANSDDPKERKQWTLFVLGLERFKSMPVDDKLSYFQIAGVQRIWENMKLIIHECVTKHELPISEADEWYKVARTWRMPYWDWARRQRYDEDLVCPPVLTQVAVRIYPPATMKNQFPRSGLYPNPLLSFENPEKDPKTGKPLPFGSMPEVKTKWNIQDNPIVHDELLLTKECD